MADKNEVNVIATRRIIKYAAGAVPGVDAPFEVIENSNTLSEQEVQEKIISGEIPISPEMFEQAKRSALENAGA